MVILPVDERNSYRNFCELAGSVQTAESCAEDDDMWGIHKTAPLAYSLA